MVGNNQEQLLKLNDLLREQIDTLEEREDDGLNDASVGVFVSIDLTNSTAFKIQYKDLWKKVIPAYYNAVQRAFGVGEYHEVGLEITDIVHLWKFVGDEVLLYAPIYEAKSIEQIVFAANDVVSSINRRILENIEGDLSESDLRAIECDLGAKGTVWIGLYSKNPNATGRNMVYEEKSAVNSGAPKRIDFLGADIDEGFRISKFAVKKRVLVSPLLAGVINATHDSKGGLIQTQYVITSYQTLKGVWKNRKVPIIMYFPAGIQDSFEYDELEHDTFCAGIRSDFKQYVLVDTNNINKIDNILQSVELYATREEIVDTLRSEEYVRKRVTVTRRLPSKIVSELE